MKNIFKYDSKSHKLNSKNFLSKYKSLIIIVMALVLITFFIFFKFIKSDNKLNITYVNNTQLYFDQYTDNLFKEQLSSDSLSAHFYLLNPESMGLENAPQTLGSYTYESMQNSQHYYINEISTLETINYDELRPEQQITYDVLLQYFRNQLDFSDLCLCSQVLSPTTGLQAQLPILFSEYTFTDKQDIENYLTLLKQVENYFAQICDFQKLKAEKNSFISDFTCNGIIAQCRSFINVKDIKDNILYSSFINKLTKSDFLSDNEKIEFSKRNREILETSIIPAYQLLISTLSDLKSKGYCKNFNGLCYLENGKDYYEYLVKNYTGSSSSVMELKSDIQNNLMSDMRTMYSLLTISPELEENFYSDTRNTMSPQDILTDLEKKAQEDFPNLSDIKYEIKYVDESLQEHLSPAFYLSPPIDADNNVIYINNDKNYDSMDLYTTLAHEGIPGHMYQSNYFSSTSPHPIRQLINYGGYTEGWATYVEFLSYYYEYSDTQLAQALSCSASYSLALYSLCDIGINYEGWTLEDTKEFLANYNMSDESVCKEIFQAVIEEPANYLQYYVGYMEIVNLKERVQKKLGKDFDLKEFHKAFLNIGPASFDVVEKWIYGEYSK